MNSGCSNSIVNYPYQQKWENGIANWVHDPNNDFDWTVRTGGTPSANTGPSAAQEGNYYIYTEASNPNFPSPDTSKAAIALGIANQLTNILRDVGEDRERGRIYLPLEDLKKFNYSEADLMNGKINENWKALMSFQLARARDWFAKSEEGIKWLSIDARWPIWTSLRLYSGILNSIEKLDYDVFNNRAYVNKWVKLFELPISYLIAQIK